MKKTAYIILFVLLILQSGGLMFLLQVKQSQIQYKMNKALNDDKAGLQKIMLSLQELDNARVGSNEISLNGKMYDVKSIITKGDFAELMVLEDSEEGSIIETIKRIAKGETTGGNPISTQLQKYFSLVYLPSLNNQNFEITFSEVSYFTSHNWLIPAADLETLSPPPRKA